MTEPPRCGMAAYMALLGLAVVTLGIGIHLFGWWALLVGVLCAAWLYLYDD